jgi:glycogen operon protein
VISPTFAERGEPARQVSDLCTTRRSCAEAAHTAGTRLVLEHRMSWASIEGLPYPLGVSWCESDRAFNFALYSKHATSVRLLLFTEHALAAAHAELELSPATHKSGRVWHCRVAEDVVRPCRYYGYVVDGPEPAGPFELHAFHPTKLLLDPYARAIAATRIRNV